MGKPILKTCAAENYNGTSSRFLQLDEARPTWTGCDEMLLRGTFITHQGRSAHDQEAAKQNKEKGLAKSTLARKNPQSV
jgi:hypothetical protein